MTKQKTIIGIVLLSLLLIGFISTHLKGNSSFDPHQNDVSGCEGLQGQQYKSCVSVLQFGETWQERDAKKVELEEQMNDEINQMKEKIVAKYDKRINPVIEKRDTYKEKADQARLLATNTEYGVNESEGVEALIEWAHNLTGTQYALGSKTEDFLDCSGLITVFGNKQGLISDWYVLNKGNAYNLYKDKTYPKRVSELERGDILYFDAGGEGYNHISIIEKVNYVWGHEISFDVIDATPEHNVSSRTIIIEPQNNIMKYKHYTVYGGTNPLIFFEREKDLQGPSKEINYNPLHYVSISEKMYFSHYNLGDPNQNDQSPCIGASGTDLCALYEQGVRTIALVRPIREKYGIEFGDKVVLVGDYGCSGEFVVHDEMNKRYRDKCIMKNGACIRGDIAVPLGYDGDKRGGVCSISRIEKQ